MGLRWPVVCDRLTDGNGGALQTGPRTAQLIAFPHPFPGGELPMFAHLGQSLTAFGHTLMQRLGRRLLDTDDPQAGEQERPPGGCRWDVLR